MDMVVEMWKNARLQYGAGFPTIPTTEKDWVIDNWKTPGHNTALVFPLINNLIVINFCL